MAASPEPAAPREPSPPPAEFPAARRHPLRIPRRLGPAVSDTLQFLTRLARAGMPPAQALPGFRRLAARHRAIPMDLVWEVEAHLGTIHYDAVLRVPGAGVLAGLLAGPGRAVGAPPRAPRA